MSRLLIDGRLVETEKTFPVYNPATGALIEEAPDASVEDADRAVLAARRAFDETSWSTDLEFRVHCLRQLSAALKEHKEELRAITMAEAGHTFNLTEGPALEDPIRLVDYYADLVESQPLREELPAAELRGQTHRKWVEKEPAGVVSAIVAYNYPTQLALAKLAPALAAGCTVVLKAAPDDPLQTLWLGELIASETDIPAGVVNVLASSEVAVGEVLTSHPAVDMITFTGSTPVGRRIMEVASATLKRVFLELGGKSALIALDDADFDMVAIVAAMTIVSHSGQGCAITSRLLVPEAHKDEIVAKIAAILANVKQGDPADHENNVGPLISEKQRDKVDGYVRRALADGATLVTGGERFGPGFFYTPTVLADVDPSSELAQDELFGPVLAVITYTDDDDAVRIANDSIFGLSGGVWGADEERAISVAKRIRTGTVSVNGGAWFGVDSPFGGYKQSGIGREMGAAGLDEFLERKTIAVPVS